MDRDRQADELAIRDVLHRYAWALDRNDKAGQRACFTEDVEAEYGGHALPRGVDSILRMNRGVAGFVNATHHVGTIVVTRLEGDEASTESYTTASLLSREPDGGHVLTTRGVRYYDDWRRESGDWRICRRVHRVFWSTQTPTEPWPKLPASFLAAAGLPPG